jgi:hypothetical protein
LVDHHVLQSLSGDHVVETLQSAYLCLLPVSFTVVIWHCYWCQVIEIRERRLDEDEVAAEVAKAIDGIKKEKELLSKKAKLLEQSLAVINQVL